MSRELAAARWDLAADVGFHAAGPPPAAFTARAGSHDDGPGHGMFLGPIGGPAFSRDLTGRFSRWHLQPGAHVVQDVDSAFLAVHWRDRDGDHLERLTSDFGGTERGRSDSADSDPAGRHETAVLFPLSHERFSSPRTPFVAWLTAFSPVVPGDEASSSAPVVVFDVRIEAVGDAILPAVDVVMFWPNLNGWQASSVSSTDRSDVAWPGHHHAGNVNSSVPAPAPARAPVPGELVLQSRQQPVPLDRDVDGDVCLSVSADGAAFSRQVQFTTRRNATGVAEADQAFTMGAVLHAFATTGRLGTTPDGSWPAHWHEPLGSAVAAHHPPGAREARTRFVVAFDWPYVRFGQGRCWRRHSGAVADGVTADAVPAGVAPCVESAVQAHQRAEHWLADIDAWHARTLADLRRRGWPDQVAGCVVNELGLVTALGTAWVDGTPEGHEPAGGGLLPGSEHLGLLEGFDEGYFYYDTSDLWHYAFPAVSLAWPRLSQVVFRDLLDALAGEVSDVRPVYRVGEERPVLLRRKLPHDLGSAAEDPFVAVNGYVMRDDPNRWRDANPAFVLATLLHHRLTHLALDDGTWRTLQEAAALTREQDAAGVGVPRHDEFGDSTWDNLALRGWSTSTAALCAGMWAALAQESRRRGQDARAYDELAAGAVGVLDQLWNGTFFAAATQGKYTGAVMPDAVLGLFWADLLDAPTGVPRERVTSHLRAAHRLAHTAYGDGRVGPLLVAEEGVERHEGDGGDELQVNEVILGSGWLVAAMLMHYDLAHEARDVAGSLRDVLYDGTGLQFRTPAAVDASGRFRAPLNMRPLAAWWLAVVAGR